MTIGGSNASETYIPDVELSSDDPVLYPVPDCLTNLSGLAVTRAAGGLVPPYSDGMLVRILNP